MQRTVIVGLALLLLGSTPSSQKTSVSARQILRKANPEMKWSQDVETDDFDCDGKNDFAFVGKKVDHVYVAVLGSRSGKFQLLRFGIGNSDEASICEEPAEIAIEDLDYDPNAEEPGDVEGFQKSPTCKGIQLIGGECDFFHIYWNHKAKHFSWWRL